PDSPSKERTMPKMHEVDYKVLGDDLQFVEIVLDPGEAVVAEAGAMMYLEDGIQMTTIFGDGSQAKGDFIDKLVGAGKRLRTGETLRVDTGCLVAIQPSVAYDIQFVGGLKSALFGGEGLFFATLRGPGRIWLQSLPFSRLASRIYAAAPQSGGRRREEGSILGGLGNLLDGDGR